MVTIHIILRVGGEGKSDNIFNIHLKIMAAKHIWKKRRVSIGKRIEISVSREKIF